METVFGPGDFDEGAMAPYFAPEEADVVAFLSARGYEVRLNRGDGFLVPDGFHCFLDRGAGVLAVAHLDTVWRSVFPTVKDGLVLSPGCDNRMGVFVAAELLERKGITVDVLVTTNEELMASTARFFCPPPGRRYDWLVSFDRAGGDAVLYGFHEEGEFMDALKESGWTISRGTYSCVAELESLGCKGVNVGVGYVDPHSPWAAVDLAVAIESLNRFAGFYRRHVGRRFPHEPRRSQKVSWADGADWGDFDG